jgi:protein TonB
MGLALCACLTPPAVHAQTSAQSRESARTNFRESDYLAPRELDVRPQIRKHPVLKYPRSVPEKITGRVVLRLFISAKGTVDRVSVVSAEPRGLFEKSAVAGFSKVRYDPGKKNGAAVRSKVTVEVNYNPEDTLEGDAD